MYTLHSNSIKVELPDFSFCMSSRLMAADKVLHDLTLASSSPAVSPSTHAPDLPTLVTF